MSVLENIRNRTGLLVGIVAVALAIFILQSALETGGSLFGSNDREVGRVGKKKIDLNEFQAKLNEFLVNYQQNSQQAPDDQMRAQMAEQVWDKFVRDNTLTTEYNKLGITVSDDELFDLMVTNPHQAVVSQLSDKTTGKAIEQFAKPDGTIDPAKIASFVQQMTPEQERFWKQMEDYVRELRIGEKYNNLIKKGLYVTRVEANNDFENQTTSASVQFVMKRYNAVADTTVQVNEADLKKYYNENLHKFWNYENTRKIEYVSFDAFPSQEDLDGIQKELIELSEEFKSKVTLSEDSAFMLSENDGVVDIASFKRQMLNPSIDSSIAVAPKGTIYGPYQENNVFKLSKLLEVTSVLDSAKVRHILVAYAGSGASATTITKDKAKRLADSLTELLKKDSKRFAEFVKTYSDDGGKNLPPGKKEGEDYTGKDGNYGWLNESSGFVESFKAFGLNGKKGLIGVVESNYGFHIMEVLDVSKSSTQKYKMATLTRKIQPSAATIQKFYAEASEFSGKNKTAELFDKAIIDLKLNKRIADNIRENDKQIPGLEEPKELIKWVYYTANLNDISPTFELNNKFIVAKLVEIKTKGTPPMEQVTEDLTTKARQEKKAELFMKEFSEKGAGASSIDDLGAKLGIPVEKADNLNFGAYSVQNVGREDAMCGALNVLKEKVMSKPFKGTNGVFVMVVSQKTKVGPTQDPKIDPVKATQKSALATLTSRVDYEVFEALKTLANIEDHKAKFDF